MADKALGSVEVREMPCENYESPRLTWEMIRAYQQAAWNDGYFLGREDYATSLRIGANVDRPNPYDASETGPPPKPEAAAETESEAGGGE